MKITRTRVLNIHRYLNHLVHGSSVRVIYDATDDLDTKAKRAGLPGDADAGATVLPAIVGRVTRFNAEGRWKIRKDLPKETRYLFTRLWRRSDWQGNISEEYYDVERECYQRELIPPPSMEISLQVIDGRKLIVSPEMKITADSDDIKHAANLMLEIFRSCEIVSASLKDYNSTKIDTVNWQFLPPGEYPWDILSTHLEYALKGASDDTKTIIEDRAETLRGYGPDRIILGRAGFRDYLAYEFASRGLVILESIQRDNAMYVFGQDWEIVSKLSKAHIIKGDLYEKRIIHRLNWKDNLMTLMNAQ